ncbi:hypothetical protein [Streptomyces sp. 2132.2]|uniref:hypothetical protein n=1 Tax=Streptomyces sp. 2132.2 TaxID=2485161 RepID=UPI000F471F6B|nr:hypothetical protein [Streptomyces sp. 2132.2]
MTCLLAVLAALLLPMGTVHATPVAQDCVAVAEGRHSGQITAAGQTHCLELPSPQGARIAALTSLGGAGLTVQVEVVDKNVAAQCTAAALAKGGCTLTGAAPFRALVHADDTSATGAYGVHFVRTDLAQNGCQVLPAGSFEDNSGTVRLDTGDGVFSHCLSIPAGAHSASELLRIRYDFPDDPGVFPSYAIRIVDTDGNEPPSCYAHPAPGQQIRTDGLTSCSFTAGKAYTVLLQGQDAPRTHTLDRRDVTATARGCETSAATAIGAPALRGTSGQVGTLRCHRITTDAATDRLNVNPRDAHDGLHVLVMDDKGGIACLQRNWACSITGSTGYQVVTQVPQNHDVAASYRLDAWRIATAAGPAPECPRVGSVAYGYGPLTGTLDEQHTGVCAVLPSVSGDRFRADITSTGTDGSPGPEPALYDRAGRNLCTGSSSTYDCQGSDQSLFVLSLQELGGGHSAYRANLVCTSAPCGSEEVSVGMVTPGTAQSGTVATLTVQGTALGMNTTVRLTGGPAPLTATTVSVSDDARTLKATVDLRTAPAGNWNISVVALGSEYARGTLTVTPPPLSGLGTYKPITPTRLMDTREGLGVPKAKIGQGGTATLQVTGTAGIPATGVTAVVLNVTATGPTDASYISVYPNGTTRTSASNLNVTAGQTIPNLVIVPVVNGKISFYNNAGTVDLIADIAGFYTTDGTGSTYKPITPTRLMDTREGLGVPKAKIGQGGTATLQVTGTAGIPATGVTAVVLNVTATGPSDASYISVYPNGTTRTSASNLNVTAGQTIPNLVIVPVVNGKISFYNNAGTVDLIADIAGFYTTDGTGSTYKPITPTRLMDTREGLGVPKAKIGQGGTATLQVTGTAGIPATGVTAVVLNVTATGPTDASYISVYPNGTTRTSASNLNVTAGQTIPNLVIVPVVNGKISFYNNAGTVDLIADIAGFYTTDGTGSTYKPITPTRLMDTREGLGVPKAKIGQGGTATLQVTGTAGIPATGVTAVVLNVTATGPTDASYISVYPNGTTRTSASNLNVTAGQTIPNLVIVPVVNGKISFYNNAGTVDLIADIAGFYTS